MTTKMNFEGVHTAIITPFQNEGQDIDYGALRELIERQCSAGIAGIVPCGTTGESPTLSHKEHRELVARTVEFVNGRMQVIAGTGSNSTREAIALTQEACKDGTDAVMLVNPYYNKPSQEGLYRHFMAIADASDVPVVVYNIKSRTAVNIEMETMQRLALHPRIQAVKEASGDPAQMAHLQSICGDSLSMLCGDDNLTPVVLALGGRGVVSVVSNIFPGRMVLMVQQYLQGNFKAGNQYFYDLLPFMSSIFWETNPVPVKAAAHIKGYCNPHLRLPLVEMSDEKKQAMQALLETLGADT